MSIGLTLVEKAFLDTLVEKASSYTLQQLGQSSDLHGEVRQLYSSILTARAVIRIVERKQQRNKDDEELLREFLLQLTDAAYDAKDLFGDLDYEVLRRKVLAEPNEEHGHGIDELKNLKQLHGSLCIGNLENVESREDACQANLGDKEYLDGLTLVWSPDRNTSMAGSIGFSGDTEVLEGLKPHRNLKILGICGYGGDKLPSWLQTQTLPCLSARILGGKGSVDQGIYAQGSNSMRSSALSRLFLRGCQNLKCLPGLHHMQALKDLRIIRCPELRSIGGLDALTSLKYLIILRCPKLTDLESLPSEREVQRKDQFISHRLIIDKTALLKQPFAHILPSSHLHLEIQSSEESVWFDEGDDQEWLQILTSLRKLTLDECPNLRSLPTWLHRLTSLQDLTIRDCPAIESLPENGLPTSLTKIKIYKIHPMLSEQLEEKHGALLNHLNRVSYLAFILVRK